MSLKSNLAKFPLPLNINEFRASRYGPKVLANSIPKSGTHLIKRVLSLTPLLVPRWQDSIVFAKLPKTKQPLKIRQGQYICSHLYWDRDLVNVLKASDVRILHIIRDLRDVAVSRAHYHTHLLTSHPSYGYFNSLESDEERLKTAIVGIDKPSMGLPSIGSWARGYTPWLNEPTCLVIRFEDLIGVSGGGSNEKQIETVRAIISHLGIELSDSQIHEIACQTFFKKASTFRKGQVGDWKNHFTDENKHQLKKVAGEYLKFYKP